MEPTVINSAKTSWFWPAGGLPGHPPWAAVMGHCLEVPRCPQVMSSTFFLTVLSLCSPSNPAPWLGFRSKTGQSHYYKHKGLLQDEQQWLKTLEPCTLSLLQVSITEASFTPPLICSSRTLPFGLLLSATTLTVCYEAVGCQIITIITVSFPLPVQDEVFEFPGVTAGHRDLDRRAITLVTGSSGKISY